MNQSVENELLAFLNDVTMPKQIVDRFRRLDAKIDLRLAKQILEVRHSLRQQQFGSLEDLSEIETLDRILDQVLERMRGQPWNYSPVLLLPVRLETRFLGNDLWVRIYPDQIFVDTHEHRLTQAEYDAGCNYQQEIASASSDEDKRNAWRKLVGLFGPERAAWIAKTVKDLGDAEPDLRGDDESWLTVPKLGDRLPDRFVVYLYRNDQLVHDPIFGNPIPRDLTMLAAPSESQEELFDDKSRWMVDLQKAEEDGMAVRISITPQDRRIRFSRVIVVGLRSGSATSGQSALEDLIDNHHYSTGLGFLEYGTPTNNTQTVQSGHSESREDCEGSYDIEILSPARWDEPPEEPRTNAQRLGRALGLGLKPEALRYISHAGNTADSYAEDMRTALWPATGDYFLRYLLPGLVNKNNLQKLGEHFTKFVIGSGPLPAIRVGDQPYGILPVTSVQRKSSDNPLGWEASLLDNTGNNDWLAFDTKLHTILQRLHQKWLAWATNSERVPRVNKTDDPDDDPDKELLQILAMEPTSVSYRTRPFVDERFIAWLLVALRNNVFGPDTPYAGESLLYWMHRWAETWQDVRNEAAQLWHSLTDAPVADLENAPLLRLLSWWNDMDLELDLVRHVPEQSQEGQGVEEVPFQYLRDLCDKVESKSKPMTLLRDLLERSLGLAENSCFSAAIVRDAICRLAASTILEFFNTVSQPEQIVRRIKGIRRSLAQRIIEVRNSLPCAQFTSIDQIESIYQIDYVFWIGQGTLLDRLFRETLDLCTHRLDAWITSLATKRLKAMRESQPSGIYLGAYGWVEDLRPSGATESEGYIHAPSSGQAVAAAVLHNAYLTHANGSEPNPFRINLNSERVRRALRIVEGVRQGQPLGALLGYQFERALHERYLDQYIDDFRNAFPIVANKETEPNPGDAVEAIAARNVVDGLALARAWKDVLNGDKERCPGSHTVTEIVKLPSLDHEAPLTEELCRLLSSVDAVSDLLMCEGVYQAVQGNFERGGAAIEAASGNAYPPEIESVCTPVSGRSLGHRVCIVFPAPCESQQGPRAAAEPCLAAWSADVLGELDQIGCRYSLESNNDAIYYTVSLQDIGISAIDALYLSASPPIGEETEIEQRIAYYVRKEHGLNHDAGVTIDFWHSGHFTYSIGEAVEIGRQILDTLGAGNLLRPGSLCLPSEADDSSFGSNDVHDLDRRVNSVLQDLCRLITELGGDTIRDLDDELICDPSNGASTRAEIIDALFKTSLYGVSGAIPPGPDDPELDNRQQNVLNELTNRSNECRKLHREALNSEPNRQIALLVDAMKALFGRSFVVLPTFVPHNVDELAQAFAQDDLLAGLDEHRVRLWLQQTAQVHSPLRELEDTLTMTEAWRQPTDRAGDPTLTLRVAQLQLPFDVENRWLALDDEERGANYDTSRDRGALSIVMAVGAHQGEPVLDTDPDGTSEPRLAGLLLDQWDEYVPSNTVNTSVSFQYDGPNSQAPQSLLLAVPSQRESTPNLWEVEDLAELAEIVRDTMDLAKIRAVDLDAMREIGTEEGEEKQGVGLMIPSLMFPIDPDRPGWARDTAFETIEDWLEALVPLQCVNFQREMDNSFSQIETDTINVGDPPIVISNLLPHSMYAKIGKRYPDGSEGEYVVLMPIYPTGGLSVELPFESFSVRVTTTWTDVESDVENFEELENKIIRISAKDKNGKEINNINWSAELLYRTFISFYHLELPIFAFDITGTGIKTLDLYMAGGWSVQLLDEICYRHDLNQ